jgi:hypothetical protein
MVDDAFQQPDEVAVLEDRVYDVLYDAFSLADGIHAECMRDGREEQDPANNIGIEEPIGESNMEDAAEDHSFDPHSLEEAIQPLYTGARCTQLAATILLMNLCTVHKVTNGFANEMFTILNAHLLPKENVLPKNYYAAQSLIVKLGLSYNNIHTYDKGCMLFQGEHTLS